MFADLGAMNRELHVYVTAYAVYVLVIVAESDFLVSNGSRKKEVFASFCSPA